MVVPLGNPVTGPSLQVLTVECAQSETAVLLHMQGQWLPSLPQRGRLPPTTGLARRREAIGLTMDSSDQLQPEQSTTALVALHSKARYFSA